MTQNWLLPTLIALLCALNAVDAQCGCPNCQPCPQCAPVLCVLRSPPPTVCSCLPPPPPPPPVYFAPPLQVPRPLYMAPPPPPMPLNAFFGSPPPIPQLYYDMPPPPPVFYQPPPPPPCLCRPQEVPCNCLPPPPPCSCDALPCACAPTLLPLPPPPALMPPPGLVPPPPPPFYSPPGAPLFDFGIPPQPLAPILGLPCPCAPNVRPCACPPNTYLFRFPFSRSRKMRRYNEKPLPLGKEKMEVRKAMEQDQKTVNVVPKLGEESAMMGDVRKLVDVLPKETKKGH